MSETAPGSSRDRQPDALREQHYRISEFKLQDALPAQERPREMFDRLGAENVSDKHLIAIILRSGVKGRNVVDIAEGLLREYGSVAQLAQAQVSDLAGVKGMGPVRAQVLKSALELARRIAMTQQVPKLIVRTPAEAMTALKAHGIAVHREFETFWVMLLDRRYQLSRPPVEVSRGIVDAAIIHPREVFKEAIRTNSAALIMVHNHPSGDPTPSAEDIRVTRQLVEAGKIVQIDVLDHVIVGRATEGAREYVSLRESGLVNFGG